MTRMTKLHVCDEDVVILRPAEAQVFYSETTDTWWMGTDSGFGSCPISYCPFCGLELSLELRAEQDDEKRSHTEPEPIPF